MFAQHSTQSEQAHINNNHDVIVKEYCKRFCYSFQFLIIIVRDKCKLCLRLMDKLMLNMFN